MFIIWGSKNKTKLVGIAYMEGDCVRCHNVTQRGVIQQQEWFTLFWIPIFPISRKRFYKVCEICQQAEEITAEEALNYPLPAENAE